MIHSIQIRQARATLKISRVELCAEANIALKTIQRLEEDEEEMQKANLNTIKKIKDYFSSRGIKFLFPKDEDEDEYEGIGLRYYKSKDQKPNF
jgi:transcriptional regulator with XRE-family HTH domain